jgi:RHH-type transcriptional regulator, rel operon repressor / antitoxin RelB
VRYMYRMPLSVRLPRDIDERLTALAEQTGRSKTYYVTEAIIEHLEDLEDLYLAEQESIEIRAGRSQLTPLADVMREYGLED